MVRKSLSQVWQAALPRIVLLATVSGTSFLNGGSNQSPQVHVSSLLSGKEDTQTLVALKKAMFVQAWTQSVTKLSGPGYLRFDSFDSSIEGSRVTQKVLSTSDLRWEAASCEIGKGAIPPNLKHLTRLGALDILPAITKPDETGSFVHLENSYLDGFPLDGLPDLDAAAVPYEAHVNGHDLVLVNRGSLGYSFTFGAQVPALDERRTESSHHYRLTTLAGGHPKQYFWTGGEVVNPEKAAATDTVEIVPVVDAGVYVLHSSNDPVRVTHKQQFRAQWLDIGSYHHAYMESGARPELGETPAGMEYPAILRYSGHLRSKALWIGVKEWTDAAGRYYPYYVMRIGPRNTAAGVTFPVQNKLIGRYPDTFVEVNGTHSFDKEAMLDEVDPMLVADRMLHNIHHSVVGITTDRRVYAYVNEFHDNYHIISYDYCNTGNIDGDATIELPNQIIEAAYFFRIHRYRGSEQAAWAMSSDQVWGRYTVHDVVGDGHATYPVDFTAQYAWYGFDFLASYEAGYSNLGSPLFDDHVSVEDTEEYWDLIADGDSVGRLSGATMMGRVILHADRSATDTSYDPGQPSVMAWIDNDEPLTSDGSTHEDYYELGILSRENPARNPGCTTCFTRAYPHFVDRRQPNGEFWNPDGPDLLAGGFSPTTAYGPYNMAPGECVNVVVAEGVAGLTFDAATKIGRAYKWGGADRDQDIITFDANGDGQIDRTPFDYTKVFVGTEAQTKNQWVMSVRDSLFQAFFRARDLYLRSNGMSTYPIVKPPRPPVRFTVQGEDASVFLSWSAAPDGPAVTGWEIYRTEDFVDNLYGNGCLVDPSKACGYTRIMELPAGAAEYRDASVQPFVDYYYYIVGVGQSQDEDPDAVSGTPNGYPLRSGRYLTQTYHPVTVPGQTAAEHELGGRPFTLQHNYPNPFRESTTIRYILAETAEIKLTVYDALGRNVALLVQQRQIPGQYDAVFQGRGLPNGLYVAVLRANGQTARRPMLLVQ